MGTPFDPSDWIDILAYVIIACAMIGAAAVPAWLSRRKVSEIHDETVNGHKGKDNLREQIDRLEVALEEGFRSVHRDIGGIREELRTERLDRIEGDKRR